jgi:hypothetical protein
MSPRRRSKKRPGRGRQSTQPLEFWKAPPALPPVERFVPARDPGAVLRSLGNPPLTGQGNAGHYLEAAASKAAQMTHVLAKDAGLLINPDDD